MHDAWPAEYIEAIFQSSRIVEMQAMVHLSLQPYCVNAMPCCSEEYYLLYSHAGER